MTFEYLKGEKEFMDSARNLYQCGGQYQRAADKVYEIIAKAQTKAENPFEGIAAVDRKETRIQNCTKYDLPGNCQLITLQIQGFCVFCFVGKLDDCEKWLHGNRGYTLAIKEGHLVPLHLSRKIDDPHSQIESTSDRSRGRLYEKIPDTYFDALATGMLRSLMRDLEGLESTSSVDDINEICEKIEAPRLQETVRDSFLMLRSGKVGEAKARIDLHRNEIDLLENAAPQEMGAVTSDEKFLDLTNMGSETLDHFVKTADFPTWMLFLHPDQLQLVEKDFPGPAKVSGVSGTGKTAIIVKRAVKLARKYPGEKILILTLNQALSRLIETLVDYACPEDANCRQRIIVASFWEFCQKALIEFEPQNGKLYRDVTWKTDEDLPSIWTEYYRCEENSDDANVFSPIHNSLLSRGIFPKEYLYQELVWIRSALAPAHREDYLSIERQGRSEPFTKPFRQMVLEGLKGWEAKMRWVGIIDYLGLAASLFKHLDKIKPLYRCVLVDEVQDFGSVELKIIRHLSKPAENDLFLCGDIVQQVYTKHHKLQDAGIDVPGARSFRIRKNYRNSVEILNAAYDVLNQNIPPERYANADFEVLNPEFSEFNTPKPLILHAPSLSAEFAAALHYLSERLDEGKKGCIAICGYPLKDVIDIGKAVGLPVLDGNSDLAKRDVFLSDLEQTKGFEFDCVCILNCQEGVIPNPDFPEKEAYREVSKFYVAMTRAKLELIISYSGDLASIFDGCKERFNIGKWEEHVETKSIEGYLFQPPKQRTIDESVLSLTGREFLHARQAVGIPVELAEKLDSLITGKSVISDQSRTEWKTIGDALREPVPTLSRMFGPELHKTFLGKFGKLVDLGMAIHEPAALPEPNTPTSSLDRPISERVLVQNNVVEFRGELLLVKKIEKLNVGTVLQTVRLNSPNGPTKTLMPGVWNELTLIENDQRYIPVSPFMAQTSLFLNQADAEDFQPQHFQGFGTQDVTLAGNSKIKQKMSALAKDILQWRKSHPELEGVIEDAHVTERDTSISDQWVGFYPRSIHGVGDNSLTLWPHIQLVFAEWHDGPWLNLNIEYPQPISLFEEKTYTQQKRKLAGAEIRKAKGFEYVILKKEGKKGGECPYRWSTKGTVYGPIACADVTSRILTETRKTLRAMPKHDQPSKAWFPVLLLRKQYSRTKIIREAKEVLSWLQGDMLALAPFMRYLMSS